MYFILAQSSPTFIVLLLALQNLAVTYQMYRHFPTASKKANEANNLKVFKNPPFLGSITLFDLEI